MAAVMKGSAVSANIKKNATLLFGYSSRLSSTDDSRDVQSLRTTKLSSLKRGTGGRSSFNGIIATVFGCTGFTGRYVINKLGKQGTQVICPHRGGFYRMRDLKLAGDLGQIQFLQFDLNDEESIRKAVKYSNVVINLIGRDNATANYSLSDVHVEGARRLARISRQAGVQRFIHLSALNASENPTPIMMKQGSTFYKTKFLGELAVREEFPEATIFRPADIYGTEDRFLTYYGTPWRLSSRTLPMWKNGEETIKQPVYVSDVAKGIVNSIFDPKAVGNVYQAVGPKRYELGELVDWFFRVMRKTDDWRYLRADIKHTPLFRLRVSLTEKFMKVTPRVSWERIEREHANDVVSDELPTLEDLGVELSAIEDRAPWDLQRFRCHNGYISEIGDFDDPLPPRVASCAAD